MASVRETGRSAANFVMGGQYAAALALLKPLLDAAASPALSHADDFRICMLALKCARELRQRGAAMAYVERGLALAHAVAIEKDTFDAFLHEAFNAYFRLGGAERRPGDFACWTKLLALRMTVFGCDFGTFDWCASYVEALIAVARCVRGALLVERMIDKCRAAAFDSAEQRANCLAPLLELSVSAASATHREIDAHYRHIEGLAELEALIGRAGAQRHFKMLITSGTEQLSIIVRTMVGSGYGSKTLTAMYLRLELVEEWKTGCLPLRVAEIVRERAYASRHCAYCDVEEGAPLQQPPVSNNSASAAAAAAAAAGDSSSGGAQTVHLSHCARCYRRPLANGGGGMPTKYCCKEHQSRHWKLHKLVCRDVTPPFGDRMWYAVDEGSVDAYTKAAAEAIERVEAELVENAPAE